MVANRKHIHHAGDLPESAVGAASQFNAQSIARELTWFSRVVNARLDQYFQASGSTEERKEDFNPGAAVLAPPDLSGDKSVYAEFVTYYALSREERLLLILALTPHVQPHLLDVFFMVNKASERGYTEFGGMKGSRHGGFLPTVETALFLLAGNDLGHRFSAGSLFNSDSVLLAHGIIELDRNGAGNEPFQSAGINVTDEYVDFFTSGKLRKPRFSTEFPAKLLTTPMNWTDLIVDEMAMKQLDEIKVWLLHGDTLLKDWDMGKRVKPGYKALFHGPPGTGKTLAATLLGKLFGLEVYRVDLSMVVSKYIGETEKNLEKVFTKAEHKNWILFFDEADALFGKRTGITDAHDKYANQEIAYLLQRLEDYPGLVILASNMRNNVDEAFTRRLQSIIYFQQPQARERLQLWKNSFSTKSIRPGDEELDRLARQYDLSGASIMNVVQYASLLALARNDYTITVADLAQGVKKEFNKEGKSI